MENTSLQIERLEVMYDSEFTKSKAVKQGEQLVADLFEQGLADPIRVLSNITRLKTVIDTADKALRDRIDLSSETSWNGVKFLPKAGAAKFNLSEDPVYAELEAKLKERGELLKLAAKSKDQIFDSEGCEVPKVSQSFSKSSITITF